MADTNSAGGIKINFSAQGAEQLKAQARAIKQELGGVAAAAQKSGKETTSSFGQMKLSLDGVFDSAKSFKGALGKIAVPVAIATGIVKIADAIAQGRKEMDALQAAFQSMASQEAKGLSLDNSNEQAKELVALLDQQNQRRQTGIDLLQKELEKRNSVWGATTRLLTTGQSSDDVIKEFETADRQAQAIGARRIRELRERQEETARLAQEEINLAESRKAAMMEAQSSGDEDKVTREKLRQDIEALSKRYTDARSRGANDEAEALDRQMAARYQMGEDELKANAAKRESLYMAEMQKASEESIAKSLKMQEDSAQRIADAERQRAQETERVLDFNREIEESQNRQVGNFNLSNASFASGEAARAGLMGERWSIASRLGRNH